ncbi:hypothetical protein [Streptomyces sp. NPDC087298]|uniref:hypothetical protein n=1 Tax=Streptomyces sp. NPDC087298 TaxID=3365779 RepID=UPI00382E82B8
MRSGTRSGWTGTARPGLVEVPRQEADQGRVLDAQGAVRLVGERDEREVAVEHDDPAGDLGERADLGTLGRHPLDVGERRKARADRVLVDGPLPDAPAQIAQVPGQRLFQYVHGTAPARVGGADLLPAARDARFERLGDQPPRCVAVRHHETQGAQTAGRLGRRKASVRERAAIGREAGSQTRSDDDSRQSHARGPE